MTQAVSWLGVLLATDTPALPAAWAMRLGLTLGWALVLASLGVVLAARLSLPARRGLAVAIVLWTLVPGTVSPDYWLGLAFHAPSLSAVLLCGDLLWRRLSPGTGAGSTSINTADWSRSIWWLLLAAWLLGGVLLLDTFAVWPLSVYAWGFSPALLLALLALSLLPWVLGGTKAGAAARQIWIAPTALLLFAATRLPTGNVWDALLDPWLWLLLLLVLIHRLLRKVRRWLRKRFSPAATRG